MVNKVILIGNLGADPEIRTSASGNAVGNMRIATTERQKGKDGEWADHTEWHSVVVFGRTAENCQKFLAKGRRVYVEGRLQTRKWQDKDGRDRWSTEVVAREVKFLGGKEGGQSSSYQGGGSSSGYSAPAPVSDDIPF